MTGLRVFLMLLSLLSSSLAHASLSFENTPRASDEELDRMRGGFIVNLNGQDFLMAFSIDQLIYINGELVSSISLNPLALTPLSTIQVTTQPTLAQTANVPDVVQTSSATTSQAALSSGQSGTSTPASSSPTTTTTSQAALSSGQSGTSTPASSSPTTTSQAALSSGQSGTSTPVSDYSVTTQVTTQGTVTIIQNGPGNTLALPSYISPSSLSTIIQNTVNNQVISNITVMNATIAASTLAAQAQLNAVLNQSFHLPR